MEIVDQLEQILGLLKVNGVTEFELEHDGTHIKLSRGQLIQATQSSPGHGVPQASFVESHTVSTVGSGAHAAAEDAESARYFKVESPIVGTFYRKPAPDAQAFVKEGDQVKKGDTLCIVEAMKLMNEIEAPIAGKVVKIGLADGQVVEYGEVLFLIDPA